MTVKIDAFEKAEYNDGGTKESEESARHGLLEEQVPIAPGEFEFAGFLVHP